MTTLIKAILYTLATILLLIPLIGYGMLTRELWALPSADAWFFAIIFQFIATAALIGLYAWLYEVYRD
jgi:ACR3 family arsenite efflux pump ArsB